MKDILNKFGNSGHSKIIEFATIPQIWDDFKCWFIFYDR